MLTKERIASMVKSADFPTVEEIQAVVDLYVKEDCRGVWPDDDWLYLVDPWEINVWTDDETHEKFATIYPVGSTRMGIRIIQKETQ